MIITDIMLNARTKDHVIIFWNKTQDEEIRRLFPFNTKSLDEALMLFEESLKEDASSYGKVIYYDGKYVGDIWCYSIDEKDERMCMLSIIIFEKDLWGNGIATETAKIFIEEIFSKFEGIEKIGAFTYSSNHRSKCLLEKVGFVKVESFIEDGVESVYYERGKR